MFDSHSLAKGLNHKLLRHRLALGVGGATDTALGLGDCLGGVEEAVGAGKLLARTICNLPSLLVCCLE